MTVVTTLERGAVSMGESAPLLRVGEMTLEEAVEVFNRVEHEGYAEWHASRYGVEGVDHMHHVYSEFEATAIAEKYVKYIVTFPSHDDEPDRRP